jgi:hypothetical protein
MVIREEQAHVYSYVSLPTTASSVGSSGRKAVEKGREMHNINSANLPGLLCDLLVILLNPENLFDVFHRQLRFIILHVPSVLGLGIFDCFGTTHRTYFTLQVTNACLPSV